MIRNELEITDIIQEIQYIQKQIAILKSEIINISTIGFLTQLYNKQLPTVNKISHNSFSMLNNKLENLKITQLSKFITDKPQ